jgi:hypothetical protein
MNIGKRGKDWERDWEGLYGNNNCKEEWKRRKNINKYM